jgi:membrane protease YdiL (CAAX protease family)
VALKIIRVMFVILVLAGLPVLSTLTARNEEVLRIPRKGLYLSAAISQWLLALLTFIVALITPTGFAEFHAIPPEEFAKWVALLTLISLGGLGLTVALEARGWWPEESQWLQALIPRTKGERFWAVVLVAPTAGFCEEFAFRGYVLPELASYLNSTFWAWIVSSVAFGMAHGYQKPTGVVRAALLGALLAWPVLRLGSIYPSMATHFLIDAVALAWLGPLTLKRHSDAENATGLY